MSLDRSQLAILAASAVRCSGHGQQGDVEFAFLLHYQTCATPCHIHRKRAQRGYTYRVLRFILALLCGNFASLLTDNTKRLCISSLGSCMHGPPDVSSRRSDCHPCVKVSHPNWHSATSQPDPSVCPARCIDYAKGLTVAWLGLAAKISDENEPYG